MDLTITITLAMMLATIHLTSAATIKQDPANEDFFNMDDDDLMSVSPSQEKQRRSSDEPVKANGGGVKKQQDSKVWDGILDSLIASFVTSMGDPTLITMAPLIVTMVRPIIRNMGTSMAGEAFGIANDLMIEWNNSYRSSSNSNVTKDR